MVSVRRTNNRFANGYSFQITLLLEKQRFLGENLFQKRSQPCTVDANALALMNPLLFPPFIQDQSRSERPWTARKASAVQVNHCPSTKA
jgi:hypothetical protein